MSIDKNRIKRFKKINYENKKKNLWKRSSNNETYKNEKKEKKIHRNNYLNDKNILEEKI